MNDIRLTQRGYRVATLTAGIVFLIVMGFVGWLENLGA
jgi:hypothetical protein